MMIQLTPVGAAKTALLDSSRDNSRRVRRTATKVCPKVSETKVHKGCPRMNVLTVFGKNDLRFSPGITAQKIRLGTNAISS